MLYKLGKSKSMWDWNFIPVPGGLLKLNIVSTQVLCDIVSKDIKKSAEIALP